MSHATARVILRARPGRDCDLERLARLGTRIVDDTKTRVGAGGRNEHISDVRRPLSERSDRATISGSVPDGVTITGYPSDHDGRALMNVARRLEQPGGSP